MVEAEYEEAEKGQELTKRIKRTMIVRIIKLLVDPQNGYAHVKLVM